MGGGVLICLNVQYHLIFFVGVMRCAGGAGSFIFKNEKEEERGLETKNNSKFKSENAAHRPLLSAERQSQKKEDW